MMRSNKQEALSLYPKLKDILKESEDPLLTAVRIIIVGNVIDHFFSFKGQMSHYCTRFKGK